MIHHLIEAVYIPGKQLPTDRAFYEKALPAIKRFAMAPQLYHLLSNASLPEHPPDWFMQRLKQEAKQAGLRNIILRSQLMQLLRAFEHHQINVIPIKGTCFAEKYFGHVGARPTSDLDLLIKPQHLEQAINLVKALGYVEEHEGIPDHFHRSFGMWIHDSSVPLNVELHWSLLKQSTSNFNIDRFWRQATLWEGYRHVRELTLEHTFYMICLHGWRHNMDSPRYYLDILQLIHRHGKDIEYERVLQMARQDRTLRRIVRTLSIVYSRYPGLHTIKAFPDQRKVRWRRERGFEGQRRAVMQYLDFIDYQFLSFDRPLHSMKELRDCMTSLIRWGF